MEYSVRSKVEFFVALVNEFVKAYSLTDKQAYRYISRYGGVELVNRHYGIMHTLDFSECVENLATYCHRQGGAL